jgi:membrane protein
MGFLKKAEDTGNEVTVPMTRRLGVVELVKQTVQQATQDHLSAYAGSLTYAGLFALFPFLAFLVSILGILQSTGVLNVQETVTELLTRAGSALPREAVALVEGQIGKLAEARTGALSLGALVSILVALWGSSGAFRSAMEAMNVMYNVEEGRPLWKKYLTSVLLSIAVAALMLTAVVLVVFGPKIGEAVAGAVGLGTVFEWTWKVLQWPILVVFVLFAFALVYYYAPDVQQKFRFITPGSAIAVTIWLIFSLLFRTFVTADKYSATFGGLANVAVLLLYMYYSAYILLLGAEINQIIERHIPGGKEIGEKVPEADKPTPAAT